MGLELPPYISPLLQSDYYKNQNTSVNVVNRKITECIKKNLPESKNIMANRAFFPFYANKKWIPLPYADYQDVIEYARRNRVDIVVINEKLK